MEIKANPNGKQFHALFNSLTDINGLPYMHPSSLNSDVILYKAMLIILGEAIGKFSSKAKNIKAFLSSISMISLRDNEWKMQPENQARKECYNFLKHIWK